jgi:hypothetical protein
VDERKKLPVIEIPITAHNTLSQIAKDRGVSLSQVVRDALSDYVYRTTNTEVNFNVGEWGGFRVPVSFGDHSVTHQNTTSVEDAEIKDDE